jgi:hypothetical protein
MYISFSQALSSPPHFIQIKGRVHNFWAVVDLPLIVITKNGILGRFQYFSPTLPQN